MKTTLTKRCKDCQKEKPATEQFFWTNPKTKDRLKTSCIDCCREYNKLHYTQNRKTRIKQVRAWQKQNN